MVATRTNMHSGVYNHRLASRFYEDSQSGSIMVMWERLAQQHGLLQEHRQKPHCLELEVSPRVNIIQLLNKILPAQKLQLFLAHHQIHMLLPKKS